MASRIREYYRKHDDYRRYLVGHPKRTRDLTRFFARNRRFFGRSILDLACGGGVLGFVAEKEGRRYVGIDINPDAIADARAHAESAGSNCKFILGDARKVRAPGRFDTVTLLGNALCHFNAGELAQVLDNLKGRVRTGSFFMVDYRDVVQVLFLRKWEHRFRQICEGRPVTSLTRGFNALRGELVIDSLDARGRKQLGFTFGVWSPFITEFVMNAHGWSLAKRRSNRNRTVWLEVYRKR